MLVLSLNIFNICLLLLLQIETFVLIKMYLTLCLSVSITLLLWSVCTCFHFGRIISIFILVLYNFALFEKKKKRSKRGPLPFRAFMLSIYLSLCIELAFSSCLEFTI